MTELELQLQRDHDEHMRVLRLEFASQVWPRIWKQISETDKRAPMPPIHMAAWLAFCHGK